MKIKRELESGGEKVWMDTDKMYGSLYETMADAVENSKLVLLCYTQSYRESEPCAMVSRMVLGTFKFVKLHC